MNIDKKTVAIAAIALILGLGIGGVVAKGISRFDRDDYERGGRPLQGMHQIPDGSMMGGRGMDMQSMMEGMNASLAGKTGDDFDKAFLAEMIVHHQGAVSMAKAAQASAKHQEIKDLAGGIIAAQEKEIADMQAWQKAWYAAQ